MLEQADQRDSRHQDPEESSVVCAARPNRDKHPVAARPRERGRVQSGARLRGLPAQAPHVSRVRDAGAEPVRLSQAEQVLASAAQVHSARGAAGAVRAEQAEEARPYSCGPEAREHHVGRSHSAAVQGNCFLVFELGFRLEAQ